MVEEKEEYDYTTSSFLLEIQSTNVNADDARCR